MIFTHASLEGCSSTWLTEQQTVSLVTVEEAYILSVFTIFIDSKMYLRNCIQLSCSIAEEAKSCSKVHMSALLALFSCL